MRHKYEYIIIDTNHVTEGRLNFYGESGWELVQVIQQPKGIKMIFKREKEEMK